MRIFFLSHIGDNKYFKEVQWHFFYRDNKIRESTPDRVIHLMSIDCVNGAKRFFYIVIDSTTLFEVVLVLNKNISIPFVCFLSVCG